MNHSETIIIECTINGMPFQLHAAPGMPLSELLRDQGLLSVKQGCCVGECGACTVLVDGTAIDSCLYLAAWAEGKEIRTLEGEAKGGKLSHVQQAYAKSGAVQCGFCTPGLIMATTACWRNHARSHYPLRKFVADWQEIFVAARGIR